MLPYANGRTVAPCNAKIHLIGLLYSTGPRHLMLFLKEIDEINPGSSRDRTCGIMKY